MLNTLDTTADPCCQKAFTRAGLADELGSLHFWTCPKCGQEYRVATVGAVRHWAAHVWTAVFR